MQAVSPPAKPPKASGVGHGGKLVKATVSLLSKKQATIRYIGYASDFGIVSATVSVCKREKRNNQSMTFPAVQVIPYQNIQPCIEVTNMATEKTRVILL